MALLSNSAVLLGKELRTEFRSRELLTTTVVFILTIVVLFSFTFDPSVGESRRFGPGLLWLALLFARADERHAERAATFGERPFCYFPCQAGGKHFLSVVHASFASASILDSV